MVRGCSEQWFCRGPSSVHPPALRVGENPLCRDPTFVPQVAGFRRPPVQIKRTEKGDVLLVRGLGLPGSFLCMAVVGMSGWSIGR